jgi:hypothetical protein
MKVGRNDPCPCGSGKKYKKCCMKNLQENQSFSPTFRFEAGSYGDTGGFVPSAACLKQESPNKWAYHFVLVNHNKVYLQEDEASAQAVKDLDAAFLQKEKHGSYYALAEYLKAEGYVSVEGFKVVDEDKNRGLH